MTTGKHQHRLLASYHRLASMHHAALAAYHWSKWEDPLLETEVPREHPAMALFRAGDYHGYCLAVGQLCNPSCPVCKAGVKR